MRKLFGISIILCVLLAASFSFAQSGTIDLNDLKGLSAEARGEIIQKKLNEMDNTVTSKVINIDPEKAEKWVKIISTTIRTICSDLSIEVNEFIRTPVGKVTTAIIVYKVIGDDLKRVVLAVAGWAVTVIMILLLMRKFHMSERIVTRDDNKNIVDVKYVPRYEWVKTSDAKITSACFHVGGLIVITAVAIILIAV